MSIQKVNFKSLDDFFDYLPASQSEIVSILRDIILEAIPDIKEKLSYNVPFYARKKNICFIWPSAILWGGLTEGVALGFMNGKEMKLSFPEIQMESRKSVGRVIIKSSQELNKEYIQSMIFEALYLDDNT